jgi:hypothetical protein
MPYVSALINCFPFFLIFPLQAGQVVPDALLKFGTHVKKKEHGEACWTNAPLFCSVHTRVAPPDSLPKQACTELTSAQLMMAMSRQGLLLLQRRWFLTTMSRFAFEFALAQSRQLHEYRACRTDAVTRLSQPSCMPT